MINRSSDYLTHQGIDNEDYSTPAVYPAETTAELINIIANRIRSQIAQEYSAIDNLVRVITDIEELRQSHPVRAGLVIDAIVYYSRSLQYIAERHGISRASVHKTLHDAGNQYPWIKSLMALRARASGKTATRPPTRTDQNRPEQVKIDQQKVLPRKPPCEVTGRDHYKKQFS